MVIAGYETESYRIISGPFYFSGTKNACGKVTKIVFLDKSDKLQGLSIAYNEPKYI